HTAYGFLGCCLILDRGQDRHRPDIGLENISLYKYPAGGKATKTLPGCKGQLCQPYDAAISLAK
ncbi:MAG: hypothetical protein WA428_01485, partial [Candidatus Cybelea sp.]